MQRFRSLAVPGYIVAALLILIPLTDTALTASPPRFGDVAWRFGTAGLFSRALMTALLGVFMWAALAALLEHRRLLRVIAVLSGIAAVLIIAVLTLFALDALQMRSLVSQQAKPAFDAATGLAAAKHSAATLVLALVCLGGWRASRRSEPRRRRESAPLAASVGSSSVRRP